MACSTTKEERLFYELATFDTTRMSVQVREAVLLDAIDFYNVKNGTNFDKKEALLAYLEWISDIKTL
jgi:hypothetical protein